MNSVGKLVETILSRINIEDTNELAEAVESWRGPSGGASLPDDPRRQKAWDLPIVKRSWENLLLEADQVSRARLMATTHKESRPWLNSLPVLSLGTLLDSESVLVAIAFTLGADFCIPHSCRCGERMDSRGLHGLSCKYSAGCFPRHSTMNDVTKRALQKDGLPLVLKLPGLDRGDGSRPDGKAVFPFSRGRSLIWNCTCVDTFAGVQLNRSATEAGTAANSAEESKCGKYTAIVKAHQFEPIAVETMGVYGGSTGVILSSIGRFLVEATGGPRKDNWFSQNLAIAIKREVRSVFSQPVWRGFGGSG